MIQNHTYVSFNLEENIHLGSCVPFTWTRKIKSNVRKCFLTHLVNVILHLRCYSKKMSFDLLSVHFLKLGFYPFMSINAGFVTRFAIFQAYVYNHD